MDQTFSRNRLLPLHEAAAAAAYLVSRASIADCVRGTPAGKPKGLLKTKKVMRRDANLIGRKVAKLRYQQKLTQDLLVAKLQVLRCNITRNILSNIELQKYVATDKHVYYLAKALKVEIAELFRP